MKKLFVSLLAAVLCLSLIACGSPSGSPSSIQISEDMKTTFSEGTELDFLIEYLDAYINGGSYLSREKAFEKLTGSKAGDFTVTRVIEVAADGLAETNISVHFLAVKANCDWADDRISFSDILLVIDYETGIVYDEFSIDESWQSMENTMEQQIWYMLHGTLVGTDYDGGPIITDAETRSEFSDADIAIINEALAK